MPSRDDLTKAWGDAVLGKLVQRARARFSAGRFVAVEGGVAVFALPNAIHRDRCEEVRPEVEEALAAHFGTPVPLQLVVDDGRGAAAPVVEAPADDDERVELVEEEAAAMPTVEDRLKQAFPGAEEVPQ